MIVQLDHASYFTSYQYYDLYDDLKTEIIKEANKHLDKNIKKEKISSINSERFKKRTGIDPILKSQKNPEFPDIYFNPEFCISHAGVLAEICISRALKQNYEPVSALRMMIDKPGGGQRPVEKFSIVDAAFEKVIFRRVRQRNLDRFSKHSYAYHPKKSRSDAIRALFAFQPRHGSFAVQIDFKDFFATIPHSYLISELESGNYTIVEIEKNVIKAFISHRYAEPDDYNASNFYHRAQGVPQGATISLLLANIACNQLDHSIVPISDFYARYADDTLVICNNFADAWRVVARIEAFCNCSGITINRKKSQEISIIGDVNEDVPQIKGIEFLGYRFENGKLLLSDSTVRRLKKHISRIVHLHLLHYLKHGVARNRCGSFPYTYDWDLVTLINELRRFIYGGISEEDIKAAIQGEVGFKSMRSIMSSYHLINNASQLKELDGFVVNIVRRAMSRRKKLLEKFGFTCPSVSNRQLISGNWFDRHAWRKGQPLDLRLPSFVRAWQAAYRFHENGSGSSNSDADMLAYDNDVSDIENIDDYDNI